MIKLNKYIFSLLLCMICAFLLLPTKTFAASTINTGKDSNLTIQYTHNNAAISTAQFDLYRIADVDAYAKYTLTGDFENYPVSLDGLKADDWKALSETLTSYASRDKLTPLDSGKTDADGKLIFPANAPNLKPGLYLIVGRKFIKGGYTYTAEPTIVSLPNQDSKSNTWLYDVTIHPKCERTSNYSGGHNRTHSSSSDSDDGTVTRKVLKVWNGDAPQSRPKEAIIQLLKDGTLYDTITLNTTNSWSYTWDTLSEYNVDGSKIIWSVTEKEMDNYTVLVAQNGITFAITNTYAPKTSDSNVVKRTVTKVWNDKGYENKRPNTVQVVLLKNKVEYETQELSDANGWTYTWDMLPKYDEKGEEISWTISEDTVSGYSASVEQKEDIFIVRNTPSGQKLPQTGVLWWPVPILLCGGMIFLIAGIIISKKKENKQ